MKRNIIKTTLVLVISVVLAPIQSLALTTHTVFSSEGLQNALTVAQSNGDDDIIYVDSSGVYNIDETLTFYTTENYYLSIVGQGTGRPQLNGMGSVQILNIESSTNVTIRGILFYNGNSATTGGGLFISTQGIVGIQDCLFSENIALNNGGGAYISSPNIVLIEDNRFEKNTGDRGGGIFVSNSGFDASLVLTQNRFSRNSASYGGGAYISAPDAGQGVISNNFFSLNSTNPKGQAGYNLYVFGTSSLFPISFTLVNNSFAGSYESADSSGTGVHITSGGGVTADIYNNIMWHGGLLGTDLAVIEETYSMGGTYANVVNNGFSDLSRVTVTLNNPGNYFNDNNISLPLPKFIDMLGGNLHLSSDSPAIDMGNNAAPYRPSVDIDGDTRIINGIVDIGADEVEVTISNPVIVVNPLSREFNLVLLGDESTIVVTVRNEGEGDLKIYDVGVADPLDPPFTMDDQCSKKTLTPSSPSCEISITFSPKEAGEFNDSFEISSNDPDNSYLTVTLHGEGVSELPSIDIEISPSPVSFGAIATGDSTSTDVAVKNIGTAYVDLGQIASLNSLDLPFSIPGERDHCSGIPLNPDETCTFTIVFAPVKPDYGFYSDDFNISFSNPSVGSGGKTVNVDGAAALTNEPYLYLNPSSIDFGRYVFAEEDITEYYYETITIENRGAQDLAIGDIHLLESEYGYSVVSDECIFSNLRFGRTCEVLVIYDLSEIDPNIVAQNLNMDINRDRSGLILEDVVVIETNATNTTGEVPVSVQVVPRHNSAEACNSKANAGTSRSTVTVQSFWSEISNANWFIFAVTFLWYNKRMRRRRRK